MPISIATEIKNEILFVTNMGDYTKESAESTFLEILEILKKTKTKNVLMDCRQIKSSLNTFQYYDYAEFVAKAVYQSAVYPNLAYLGYIDDEISELRQFAENVAVNRSANFKIFLDINQAITWLGSYKT